MNLITTIIAWVKKEPAIFWSGLATAGVNLGADLGFHITRKEEALVATLSALVLAAVTRSQVSPS